MNYLDIAIALVLIVFGVKGRKKGLIIEIVSLLAFGVGIYGAMHFSDFTAKTLVEYIEIAPQYLNTAAFVLTFILLVILVNMIGRVVSKVVTSLNLGWANKLGGFVFGAAKGMLLCSLSLMVLNNFQLMGFVKEEMKAQSKLYPYIEKTVPYIYQGFDIVKDAVQTMREDAGKNTSDETDVASEAPKDMV